MCEGDKGGCDHWRKPIDDICKEDHKKTDQKNEKKMNERMNPIKMK